MPLFTMMLPYFGCRNMIYLHNVTLLVPKQDFMALLSAAVRGPRWKSGARSTADLIGHISKWNPINFDEHSIYLSQYR